MPLLLQAKLLRVIEDKTVRPVGSDREVRVDVRILSATNRDIEKEVGEGRFRQDLYYRLNAFEIQIPPLRERPGDISPILEYYVALYSKALNKKIRGTDPRVMEELKGYPFHGNVRELKNMAEKALILCDGDVLEMKHFPVLKPDRPTMFRCGHHCPYRNLDSENQFDLAMVEVHLIREALKQTGNNKNKASKLLNISWNALDRRMKKYAIRSGD